MLIILPGTTMTLTMDLPSVQRAVCSIPRTAASTSAGAALLGSSTVKRILPLN